MLLRGRRISGASSRLVRRPWLGCSPFELGVGGYGASSLDQYCDCEQRGCPARQPPNLTSAYQGGVTYLEERVAGI